MTRITHRIAVALVTAIAAGCTAPGGGIAPDTIWYNGLVITMEDDQIVEAVAVLGDEIVAVGGTAEIQALAGPDTRMVDLDGHTMTPGFYAAHDHFPGSGRVAVTQVDLNSPPIGTIENMDQLVAALPRPRRRAGCRRVDLGPRLRRHAAGRAAAPDPRGPGSCVHHPPDLHRSHIRTPRRCQQPGAGAGRRDPGHTGPAGWRRAQGPGHRRTGRCLRRERRHGQPTDSAVNPRTDDGVVSGGGRGLRRGRGHHRRHRRRRSRQPRGSAARARRRHPDVPDHHDDVAGRARAAHGRRGWRHRLRVRRRVSKAWGDQDRPGRVEPRLHRLLHRAVSHAGSRETPTTVVIRVAVEKT